MGIQVNSSKQWDEPRKRLSKLRSVKISNLDRLRLSMKRTKSRLSQEIALPDDSVEMDFQQKQSSATKFERSPNYMKATNCFNARSGSSQVNPGGNSVARKSVKRMYSLKRLRKLPSMRSDGFLGNVEVDGKMNVGPAKLNLIRSGSIKITRMRSIRLSRRQWSKSRLNQASNLMSDDEPNAHELPSESDLQNTMSPTLDAPNLKHIRTLYKMPSLRSKRRSTKKKSKFDGATCSSALKRSKIPQADHVSGECEYESQLIGHVCPYTYCSLHGHLHSPAPPLKSFISAKRRLLKKQRSIRSKRKAETAFYRGMSRMNQSVPQVSLEENADSSGRSQEFSVEIYDDFTEPRKADDAESIGSNEVHEQSSVPDSAGILSDNRKYTNMWKLIYKHLSVPGAEEINRDVGLKRDQGDENQDMNVESQVSDSEKLEFDQAEAIEFVQQAVDEILHLDDKSPLNPADPAKEAKDIILEANNGVLVAEQEKDSNGRKQKPMRQRSKGFEKLRKMINTAKFVHAVEKLRRINPRKPRFLSPEEMARVERVQLRHLNMDGRRNGEEWMLDFALQQVISKLAPAQQRRVGMLVQAFERVTPEMNITFDPEKISPTNYSGTTDIVVEEERSIELDLDNIVQDPRNAELDSFGVTEDGEEGSYDGGLEEVIENAEDKDDHMTDDNGKQELNREEDQVKGTLESNSSNLSLSEETNVVFDKEKFTNVWHMVYRQFIAQEDAVSGEKKTEVKEQDENVSVSRSSSINQADAVQLVQEAIDELLCLHVQLSDQQPSKSSKVSEQNKLCSPDSTDPATENTDDTKALQRQKSKPLSRLRKMVLSAKFINTMEKLRKIRTCKVDTLPSEEVSPGAEKVSLRHLSADERRNGEEWMLDSALQQVISKLAPAKQRRVALLTQAFETLTPELQQMSRRNSRTKMQSEDYTTTNEQRNEDAKFVATNHGTPIIHDDSVPKSDDPIQNQTNTEGCPPSCSDNIQKGDPYLKTKDHTEQEQTVLNYHEDDKASSYVLEGGKYPKMWKMIYQHVKSNSCADSENQTAEIRAKEDQTDGKLEITQSDAIKLVQEAVDGILQQPEKSEEGNKFEQNSLKGYNRWKRAIICTKFVNAMEKMQKLYTQKKRSHYNPLISDQEAETVRLRQCLMDERSNSEVWMLDYALRQVIAKLAPVQQQKVALLIEAFETVGPNTGETTAKEIERKVSDPSDIVSTAGNEEVNRDYDESQESSESQDTGKDTNDGGNNVFLEGKKYSSMWHLIHKHIKSGIPNADAEEQTPTETDVSDSDSSSTNNEAADHIIDSESAQIQQKDAIKLVEEAVNEILEMKVQSTDSVEKPIEEEKARHELPSVMSKVILCKKFIKAMEKMKKSKPKVQRRYLPQQSETSAENVRLRAQRMDDKNCDEWMLDYALQQVIGKLAPTQKKTVSLLVEAFERVNPPPDPIRHQRSNVVA